MTDACCLRALRNPRLLGIARRKYRVDGGEMNWPMNLPPTDRPSSPPAAHLGEIVDKPSKPIDSFTLANSTRTPRTGEHLERRYHYSTDTQPSRILKLMTTPAQRVRGAARNRMRLRGPSRQMCWPPCNTFLQTSESTRGADQVTTNDTSIQ